MALFIFWAVAAAMTLAVAGLMIAALSRGTAEETEAAVFDMQVFRDQLSEVDRDLARGVIAEDEAARLRTEISRRILGADAALQDSSETTRRGPSTALSAGVIVVLAVSVTLALYLTRGAPGLDDQPMRLRLAEAQALRAERPSQAEAEAGFVAPQLNAEASHLDLIEKLREVMRARPDDVQGQVLLARNEAGLGNFPAAAHALNQVLRLKGDAATLDDMTFTVEMMVMAASGTVTPETEALLTQILQRDPRNDTARFQSGRLMLQTGRPDLAFRFWAPLWEESPDGAYWLPILEQQLPDLAWLAGQHRYERPARKTLAGPKAQDLEAAAALTPEQRVEMARGMVDSLMARLATEGGSPAEWGQLLRGLSVLNDTERAQAILAEARERFAAAPEALAEIDAAARDAGLIQ